MAHIYFVRHGQTHWNVANKICGATDIDLTETGHKQAIETGRIIAEGDYDIDEILCSPLMRAEKTAMHIAQMTGIPCKVEPALKEQNFGKYEGTPRNNPEFHEAKKDFINDYDGGESMAQMFQRIYNLLDRLKKDDKTYLLVAHNGIARIVKSYFNNMTNEEFAAYGIDNCAILRFDFD